MDQLTGLSLRATGTIERLFPHLRALPLVILFAVLLTSVAPQIVTHIDLVPDVSSDVLRHGHSHGSDDGAIDWPEHAVTDHEHHLYVLTGHDAATSLPFRSRPVPRANFDAHSVIRDGPRRPPRLG
ncbi:hypothetical protein [Acuticoccus kandeliae]|uniref:hypothetical protein n=1 Tax=Acuticoccus kandeliae TaxID=2073160 RepID=UPI000D3E9044|nr:hypothetical protein [Acuticoccus kandeliae]